MSSLVEVVHQSTITSWIRVRDVLGIVFVFHARTIDWKYDCIGMANAFYVRFCLVQNELQPIVEHHPLSQGLAAESLPEKMCHYTLVVKNTVRKMMYKKMQHQ